MSTIQEIEMAVQGLSDDDLAQFRDWFADFDYARWDRQLADDVAAGRLDHLTDEALKSIKLRGTT